MTENKQINVEFTEEMCPHCDILVEIPAYMGIYECPHCHKLIVSCSMCDKQNCNNCKFTIDEQLHHYKQVVEEIKEKIQNEHPFVDCSCGQDILEIIQKCEEVNNE